MYENAVLAIFHTSQDTQDVWKNAGRTFQCIVVLQSREQGPKKMENYVTNLTPPYNNN